MKTVIIAIIIFGAGFTLGILSGLSVKEVDPNFVNLPKPNRKEDEV